MLVISGSAVVLAVAAVVMGVLAWTRPDPAPITTTVTPSAPVYSAEEVSAARDEACAASKSVVSAVYEASVPLVAALPNRDSPEYKAALANEQSVVLVEMEYLRLHTPPATPREIADPMGDYIDATHAVQLPGADPRTGGASTGGRRDGVPVIAAAAVAAGADGVFLEFHPEPDKALCDAPSCLALDGARDLLATLKALHGAVNG